MELTSDEIKQVIRDAISAEHENFRISAEQHYLDHEMLKSCRENNDEMRKNHEWISGVRSSAELAGKTGVKVITITICSFVIGAIYFYVKSKLGN